jgi:hypothetical protein
MPKNLDMDHCPICQEDYQYQCKCRLSDRGCKQGHKWHACPKCGAVVPNATDHSLGCLDPHHWCVDCVPDGFTWKAQ